MPAHPVPAMTAWNHSGARVAAGLSGTGRAPGVRATATRTACVIAAWASMDHWRT